MALAHLLEGDDVFVALEITPPRRRLSSVLLRRASLLDGIASAVNVIQRPDRQSSLDASCDLRGAGYDPVWHLVARGEDAHQLQASIERATASGVTDVLCILGDRPGEPAMKVRDMVAAVSEGLAGSCVGATVNQYTALNDKAVANLLGKLDAGACFVETQPVFALQHLEPVVTEAQRRFPNVRFIAMAMPVETPEAASRMEARLQIEIPAGYRERIEAGREAAWQAFADNLHDLRQSGLVAGIAIMTPEMDPSPGTRERLHSALQAAGLAKAPTAH